jgi:hypothetical protein
VALLAALIEGQGASVSSSSRSARTSRTGPRS